MLLTMTITLFLFGIILVCIKKYCTSEIQSKNLKAIIDFVTDDKFMDYFIGIITTILGITIALWITNHDNHIADVQQTVSLIQAVDRELERIEDNILLVYVPIIEQYIEQGTPDYAREFLDVSPVTFPLMLETVLSSELVITNTNIYSFSALIDAQRSFIHTFERLRIVEDSDSIIFELKLLLENIEVVREVIANEIAFLNGNVRERDMRTNIELIFNYSLDR